MRTGHITRSEAWLEVTSTIMRTLSYPLPALNLTKSQCEDIMRPIWYSALPAMGFCCTFPRDIVFGPKLYLGIGFKHLYTIQETMRSTDILYHTHFRTTTGNLYVTSFELFFIELGLGTNILQIPSSHIAAIATNSLVKSACLFLHQYKLELCHTISYTPNRINDICLMSTFFHSSASLEDMLHLNHCRLFLRAYYLSDITSGNSSKLMEEAWAGHLNVNINRDDTWPRPPRPTKADWTCWRLHISRTVLSRGRRLVQPLGPWLRSDSSWIWYFSPADKTLWSISGELWKQHLRLSGPYRVFCFQRHEFVVHQPPLDLQPASVYLGDSRVMLSGFAFQVADYVLPVPPFHNFLTSKPDEQWCFQHLLHSDNGEHLCAALQSHTAIALSDGSYKEGYSAAAWALEGENKHGRMSGAAVVSGDDADHSSYRSEITGL
jgi:hypothetical protein